MVKQTSDLEPFIEVIDNLLIERGFTQSGLQQYRATMIDYSNQISVRALNYGNIAKANGMFVEITHEHVRSAALSIARSFGFPVKSKWFIVAQICEYIAMAAAGLGGGYIDKQWGTTTFILGLFIATILIVIRLTQAKGE